MDPIEQKGESPTALADRLEYMADMILELREMARGSKLETLAGILDLAYTETCLRARDAA
jgi:hypothetical protein